MRQHWKESTIASDDGNKARRVALYAPVSTDDKVQDPETQIHALERHYERRTGGSAVIVTTGFDHQGEHLHEVYIGYPDS